MILDQLSDDTSFKVYLVLILHMYFESIVSFSHLRFLTIFCGCRNGFSTLFQSHLYKLFLQFLCFDCKFVACVNPSTFSFHRAFIFYSTVTRRVRFDRFISYVFVVCFNNTFDILTTVMANFYCVCVEDFMQFIGFGEVFVEQGEKRLTNF